MANTKIQSEQIADLAIVTDRIAADAVTTAKIADNVALGGSPTTTTQSASDNSTKIATTEYVTTAISSLIDSAPSTLNTLNEIAAALNDDANFNTTVTNSIAAKLPLAGGTMTGALNMGSQNITNVGNVGSPSGSPLVLTGDSGANIELYGSGGSNNIYIDAAQVNYRGTNGSGTGSIAIGTTVVIDGSRNLTNIGTISSGAIDVNSNNIIDVNQINGTGASGWLDFNMDADNVYPKATSDNQTVLGSVTHMNFVGDSNGNGTGGVFYWGYGVNSSDSGTFTETMNLDRSGNLTTQSTITSNVNSALEYSTTEAAENNLVGSDALALMNNENSSTNGKVSLFMKNTGGGGTASGRITLKNNRSGSSGFGFFLRDNGHTTEQQEKMFLDSDGNATFAGSLSSGAITSTGIITADQFTSASGDVTFRRGGSSTARILIESGNTTSGQNFIVTNAGDLTLQNTTAAPTNSVSVPGSITFEGRGWDSDSGSQAIRAKIVHSASYGDHGSGATQGALIFYMQGAGGLDSSPNSLQEAMRLDAGGAYHTGHPNLGINTADIHNSLHVRGDIGQEPEKTFSVSSGGSTEYLDLYKVHGNQVRGGGRLRAMGMENNQNVGYVEYMYAYSRTAGGTYKINIKLIDEAYVNNTYGRPRFYLTNASSYNTGTNRQTNDQTASSTNTNILRVSMSNAANQYGTFQMAVEPFHWYT